MQPVSGVTTPLQVPVSLSPFITALILEKNENDKSDLSLYQTSSAFSYGEWYTPVPLQQITLSSFSCHVYSVVLNITHC